MTDTAEPTARESVMGDNSEAMDVKAMLREEPKAIYHDTKMLPKLLAQLDKEIAAAPKDVADKKDRESVRSAAFDIAKLKTKLDGAGKDLTEDYRKKTKEVNDVRNEITGALEQRQAAMREPLTKWEEAEKAREESIRGFRKYLEDSLTLPAGATLEKIAARRQRIATTAVHPDVFQELTEFVEKEKAAALQALDGFKAQIEKAEADRLELEKLRQEKIEREAREAAEMRRKAAEEEARIQREAAERERQEAIANAAREAAEKAEREAQEREAEAERQREAAAAELRRKADEEVAAANARAEAAEEARLAAERNAAREREEAAQVARRIEEAHKAQAAEDERRRKDQEHRQRILEAIVEDIVAVSAISSTKAQAIAQAIAAGSVRNVTVEF
jgi:colicin import membrane protein